MSKLLRVSTVMLILLALPTALSAGIWDNMNYQGILVDSTGAKVDGLRSITFSIWDAATEGVQFWDEEVLVQVVDGLVNVTLGEETPLSTLSGLDEYFLQIQIGSDAPMTRIKLTAVPYALSARNADKLDGFTTGSDAQQIPINNSTLNESLNADMLDGHDAGNEASDVPISNGALNVNLNADKLDGLNEDAFADSNHTHPGYAATSHTHVMDDITDLTVGNTAGVNEGTGVSSVTILDSETALDSVKIDAPAAGMCLVIATVEIALSSSAGASVFVGLGDTDDAIPSTANFTWQEPDSVAVYGATNTMTVQNLFTVSGAGVETYYLVAMKGEAASTVTATTRRVSAIYFPLSYAP
ncbi:MAG: hypothetical protein ABIJ61_02095 [bacterium]